MTFEVVLASLPDRDNVVAELWLDKQQVAEITSADGAVQIEIYARPDNKTWAFSLDTFEAGLRTARERILR